MCLVEKLGRAQEQEHSDLSALRRNSPKTSPMRVTKASMSTGASCMSTGDSTGANGNQANGRGTVAQ